MGGRLTFILTLLFTLPACDDAPLDPSGCAALGTRLAVGEQAVDEAACVVCRCQADGLPACTPWPACPDRGVPPDQGPAADGATGDAAPDATGVDAQPPDAGFDAGLVPTRDHDGDGQPTDVERVAGTDPFDPTSFSERFLRVPAGGVERIETTLTPRLRAVDVAFVVDATSSQQPVIDGLAAQLGEVARELAERIPDARYGVGAFRDYEALAGGGNFPFRLFAPLDPDVHATVAALAGLRALGGGDSYESAYEALQQALTGAGYDENCDGAYTPGADVLPYVSHPRDAFGGQVVGAVQGDPSRLGKGGVGFAPGALPVVILATDARPRDPRTDVTPGGCPFDADQATVVAAARALGARLITLYTRLGGGEAPQGLVDLTVATGSVLPAEDGGVAPLVFDLAAPAALQGQVVRAVTALLGATRFADAAVAGEARPPVLTVTTQPAAWGPIAPADFGVPREVIVDVSAEAGGRRIVALELQLTSASGVVLDRQPWWVLVE